MTFTDPVASALGSRARRWFRAALGLIALLGGLGGLAGLYFVPIPESNRDALLLALGLVLGWGSTVIGYEFGSSPTGRRAAAAGIPSGRRRTGRRLI